MTPDQKPPFRIPGPEECDELLAELDFQRLTLLYIQRQHRKAAGKPEDDKGDDPATGE